MGYENFKDPKIETWKELVDESLGRHKEEVESIMRRTSNPQEVVRLLGTYMRGEGGVSMIEDRDNAEKCWMKMPEFVDTKEEALWNLFVQFRSDQY